MATDYVSASTSQHQNPIQGWGVFDRFFQKNLGRGSWWYLLFGFYSQNVLNGVLFSYFTPPPSWPLFTLLFTFVIHIGPTLQNLKMNKKKRISKICCCMLKRISPQSVYLFYIKLFQFLNLFLLGIQSIYFSLWQMRNILFSTTFLNKKNLKLIR